MTTGTVISYDADEEEGYLDPDEGDERIPFDRRSLEGFQRGTSPHAGDRVTYVVEGGMAGIWATEIRLIEAE